MVPFDPARIAAAANSDPEFAVAARFWNGALRFDAGNDALLLRLKDGRVTEFAPLGPGPSGPFTATISATPEQWEHLLAPVPAPFYQDWMAASRHGVVLAGDPVQYGPYYPALRRLLEIMRDGAREG